MQQPMKCGWAGVDVGKGHHRVCLIDEAGTIVWSAKMVNDEGAILEAISAVLARAEVVVWAVDVTGTMSGLLLALLAGLAGRCPELIAGREGLVLIDIDDTIGQVHGYAKQAAAYGYTGVKG